MAESPYIHDITEANYQQLVIDASFDAPVLVDFWASWCQPCQVLMPILAKLVDEYQGRFLLAKLNTEEQQTIATQFGIRSIPTVKLFRDGAPIDEFAGALPEAQIRAFLDKYLPRESDGVVQTAAELITSDPEQAIALLEQARADDPNNPRISATLAQALAVSGRAEEAEAALASLPPDEQDSPENVRLASQLHFIRIVGDEDTSVLRQRLAASPEDSETCFRAAAANVLEGSFEDAMDQLLTLMQRDRAYGDDAARKTLIRLFDLLGDDPAVTRYRARMFNLLH